MGDLKNHIFLQFVNRGLDAVRDEFIQKNTPKKENRFFIKGITYEISPCHIESGKFIFEISSKIPQEMLPRRIKIEKFFNEVVKIVKKSPIKPDEWKMENIVRNTNDLELKERDYVKLNYSFREDELYTGEDLAKRMKHHQTKGEPIPDIPGIATPSGRLIVVMLEESMAKCAHQVASDFVKANETVKKQLGATRILPPEKVPAKKKPAAKKKTAKPKAKAKPAAKAKKKPAAKKKKK